MRQILFWVITFICLIAFTADVHADNKAEKAKYDTYTEYLDSIEAEEHPMYDAIMDFLAEKPFEKE